MTLVSVTAYHSFGGHVEVSNTPTIRRLTPSCRHQLPRIALTPSDITFRVTHGRDGLGLVSELFPIGCVIAHVRISRTVPKRAPIPAVTPIARAPQKVTRIVGLAMFAPPALAPIVPS